MTITLDNPIITQHPTLADSWILVKEYRYKGHGIDVTIPKGFVTDLASVPRALWNIIAPFELSTTAPVVHDWFYRHGGVAGNSMLSRAQTDSLFLDIMKDEGVSWWRRRMGYLGVRAGGWLSWNSGKVLIEQIQEA